MPRYKLRRRFYDGKQLYAPGAIVELAEGVPAPSSALKLDEEPEAEETPSPEPEPELDLGSGSIADAKVGDTLSSLSKKK